MSVSNVVCSKSLAQQVKSQYGDMEVNVLSLGHENT
jgi:hypothetical protein